jgi:hypothetical protein
MEGTPTVMNDCKYCNSNEDLICCYQQQEFKDKMKIALETEESPLDAKLDHVIPGLKEWHSANNQAVNHLDRKIDLRFQKMQDTIEAGFGTLSTKADRQEQLLRKRLASSLMTVATDLLQGNSDMDLCDDEDIGGMQDKEAPNAAQEPTRTCTGVPVGRRASPPTTDENQVTGTLASDYKHIQLTPKHTCLSDLWDEWYGLGKYTAVAGGIDSLETKFKATWRRHLEGNQFSRTKRLVKAIADMSKSTGKPVEQVLEEQNEDFLQQQCSVGLLVEYWKRSNYIKKNAPRGRKSGQAIHECRQQQ